MFHMCSRALGALALGLVTAIPLRLAWAEPATHVVAPGESLWVIAKRYGISAQDLASANGLAQARTLHSGFKLVVPVRGSDAAVTAAESSHPAPDAAPTITVLPMAATAAAAPFAAPRQAQAAKPSAAAGSQPIVLAPATQPRHPHPAASAPAPNHKPTPAAATKRDRIARAQESVSAPSRIAPVATIAPSPTPPAAQSAPTAEVGSAARTGGAAANPAPAATATAATRWHTSAQDTDAKAPGRRPRTGGLFPESAKSERGYGFMSALDFILKLALVVILAYVSMLALKKFTQRRTAASGKGAALRAVDTIGLAPNRQLHIVTLGERAFLLGSTPESVSLISDISEAQSVPGATKSPPHAEQDPAFTQRLRELMKAAPAGRRAQSGVGLRLAQAAQFIKARSNQMRPLGEIIDETLSG